MIHHDCVAWDNRRMMLVGCVWYIVRGMNFFAACLDSSLVWCCCDGAYDWNVLMSIRVSTHNSVKSSSLPVAVLAQASVQLVVKPCKIVSTRILNNVIRPDRTQKSKESPNHTKVSTIPHSWIRLSMHAGLSYVSNTSIRKYPAQVHDSGTMSMSLGS